jgi:Lectin C-type domain
LAAVTSEEENNLIWALGNRTSSNAFLLLGGMQDQSVDEDNATTLLVEATRGWSWLEEGSFTAGNFTGDLVRNDYANWDTGEPDQRGGDNEDCVTLYTGNGKWHDRLCDVHVYPFVLEFDFTRNDGNDNDGSNTINQLVSILDGCSAATTVVDTIPDPLISVLLNEGGDAYVCRYLSDAIDELVTTAAAATTTTTSDAVDNDVESSLTTLFNSLSNSLTPEQITIITECVTSFLME